MRYCLGVDVAAIDSMYCLAAETGEVIFMPEKRPHTKDGFHQVLENFGGISHEDITVIMESTSTYHLKVERFFRENTVCEVVILNPMISKNHRRNFRKTKTDKEDCLNLIDIFSKANITTRFTMRRFTLRCSSCHGRSSTFKKVPHGHGIGSSSFCPC